MIKFKEGKKFGENLISNVLSGPKHTDSWGGGLESLPRGMGGPEVIIGQKISFMKNEYKVHI